MNKFSCHSTLLLRVSLRLLSTRTSCKVEAKNFGCENVSLSIIRRSVAVISRRRRFPDDLSEVTLASTTLRAASSHTLLLRKESRDFVLRAITSIAFVTIGWNSEQNTLETCSTNRREDERNVTICRPYREASFRLQLPAHV